MLDQELSNFNLRRVFWENENSEQIFNDITNDPDILICSCYVWNWPKTYQAIQKIKKTYTDCLVVIGGPEPHYSVEWMNMHPEIDILIPYYGEQVFQNVLREYNNNKNYNTLDGVITQTIYNRSLPTIDYDSIPSPYLNGFFDQLIQNKRPETKSLRCVFESNRGCPYGCAFCDLGAKAYQKVKKFDLERCKLELGWIVKNNIRAIDVADSNFGIFDRDEEIVDTLIDLKINNNWNGRFLPTWSKARGDRVLRIAKKVITNKLDSIFGLSLQSLHQPTLDAVKRINAFDLNDMSNIIEDMNVSGVPMYTELIFPMPGDTLDNFKEGIYRLLDMPVTFNKFQINQLSQLTNTEFNSELYNTSHGMQWANVKGFTRHYYGSDGAKDTIAIATKDITIDETFEGLFFSKCVVIPFYFYGIIRHFADTLHKNNTKTRSQIMQEIIIGLETQDWFIIFKKQMKQHYMEAIAGDREFGFAMLDDSEDFFGEFTVAHRTYIENNIHEFLKSLFPEHVNLIEYDDAVLWKGYPEIVEVDGVVFKDTRSLGYEEYIKELYVLGRFDDRWMKQEIS